MKPKDLVSKLPKRWPEGAPPETERALNTLVASLADILRTLNTDPLMIENGNVHVGFDEVPTTVTKGFLYIPRSNGAPTGTPAKYGGIPLVYDRANDRLYAYNIASSAWKWIATSSGILAQSAAAVTCPNDLTEDALVVINVPAGLGANSRIDIVTHWSFSNNANNKTLRIRYSGGAGATYLSQTLTTQIEFQADTYFANRNSTSSQVGGYKGITGVGTVVGNTQVTSAVDTTAATTIVITAQKGNAADVLKLESYQARLSYGA